MKSIIKNIIDKTPFTDRNVTLKNSLSTLITKIIKTSKHCILNI